MRHKNKDHHIIIKERVQLQRRMITNTKRQPYACDQCDMAFRQAATLANHKKFVHLQIRPFVCEKCGKREVIVQNLRKHALIHTGAH